MSLTDSYIGWETTGRLLRRSYKKLTKAAQSVISAAQPIYSL
jgi:3-deoxy-D-arabino-heptulosonate 7-phosphate (DAHP) synthase